MWNRRSLSRPSTNPAAQPEFAQSPLTRLRMRAHRGCWSSAFGLEFVNVDLEAGILGVAQYRLCDRLREHFCEQGWHGVADKHALLLPSPDEPHPVGECLETGSF